MPYTIIARSTWHDRHRQQPLTQAGFPARFETRAAAEEIARCVQFVKDLNHEYFPDRAPRVLLWVQEITE
jgi:hypothetical protein